MLNPRESAQHSALCAARHDHLVLLAAVGSMALGLAAVAMLWPQAWFPVGLVLTGDVFTAAFVMLKLIRISRRIEQLEGLR